MLQPVHDPQRAENAAEVSHWAHQNGFALDSQYDFYSLIGNRDPLQVNLWRSEDGRHFLAHYHFAPQKLDQYEFVSGFPPDHSLVTSAIRDSLTLPLPPGQLLQVFPGLSIDELHEKHAEALELLEEKLGVKATAPGKPAKELLIETIEKQIEHVRSLPFWYLRGPWWYLVRRSRLANRSLKDSLQSL